MCISPWKQNVLFKETENQNKTLMSRNVLMTTNNDKFDKRQHILSVTYNLWDSWNNVIIQKYFPALQEQITTFSSCANCFGNVISGLYLE